jgi:hypothetical protein
LIQRDGEAQFAQDFTICGINFRKIIANISIKSAFNTDIGNNFPEINTANGKILRKLCLSISLNQKPNKFLNQKNKEIKNLPKVCFSEMESVRVKRQASPK